MKIISVLIKLPILKRLLPSLIRRILILLKIEFFNIKFKNLILETNIYDPHDREIFFSQKYEEKQFNELFNIISQHNIKIFFDIGANSGIYSLILSHRFKDLIIEAFEPILPTYKKFLRNIEKNKLVGKINTYNIGLSNQNKILKMQTNVKFGYNQSAGYYVSESGDQKAEFKSADEIFNYKNRNILIKIDTEGHEKFALKGMKNLIKNNNTFLQIEIWEKNYDNVKKIIDGYDLVFLKKIDSDYYFKKIN